MNRIIEILRQGMTQRLLVGSEMTPTIPAGESLQISVPIEQDLVLIKSVEVTANKQIPFRVEFFEESTMLNSRYNSGSVVGENYDVLDLPYVDKDQTQSIHFFIENTSDFEANFTIEVRGIAMK